MTTVRAAAPGTDVFGHQNRGALLIGFRAPQLLVLGLGVLAVLVGLLTAGGRGGLVGVGFCAAAVTVALFPVQGRPLVDWARPVPNSAYRRIPGKARSVAGPAHCTGA